MNSLDGRIANKDVPQRRMRLSRNCMIGRTAALAPPTLPAATHGLPCLTLLPGQPCRQHLRNISIEFPIFNFIYFFKRERKEDDGSC